MLILKRLVYETKYQLGCLNFIEKLLWNLYNFFLSFFEDDVYPDDLKKSNVVPIYKKESKNLIRNYRSISLLPVFRKVFGKIIFNSLPNSFLENKLLTECQSGFLPGDSYISQLFFISSEIYKSFDCNPSLDVRGTF